MKDLSKVLLVTDLDGTLLTGGSEILPDDMTAIERFKAAGGKFTIATGRAIYYSDSYVDRLKITLPVILFNGAMIFDVADKKIIYERLISDRIRDVISDVTKKFPQIACEILTHDNIYVVQDNSVERRHNERCGVTPVYADLADVPYDSGKGWYKSLFAMDAEVLPELAAFLAARNETEIDFVQSSEIFYEALPRGCSKGGALKEYVKLLGMEDYTVYAAGDYHNDIEMLECADFGAAPSNAQADVRTRAKIKLNRTNNEGAIAELIDIIMT